MDSTQSEFSEFERTMQEVDRLIAESEAYLENAQRESLNATTVNERNQCIDVPSDDDDSTSTATPKTGSPASEAIVAAARAVANTASNLLNDSEIEILDCTTFPMPLPNNDDDDDVFFVSEAPLINRNTTRVIDLLSSPSPHININANFGRNPTNISVNIDLGSNQNRPQPPIRITRNTAIASGSRARGHTSTSSRKRKPVAMVEPAKKQSPEPETPSTGNGFACAVCLEDLKAHLKPVSTNCGHLFCLNCLQQSIRISGKCPLCNKKQGKNTFHRIYI
ncbi:RNF4 family protein [Megaselia abdita]